MPADDAPRARERTAVADLLGVVHTRDHLGVMVQRPDAKHFAVGSTNADVAAVVPDCDLLRRAQAREVFGHVPPRAPATHGLVLLQHARRRVTGDDGTDVLP